MSLACEPQVVVRDAHKGDSEAIAAIYGREVAHGTASFEFEPPDEAEMRRRMASVQSVGLPYLVAESDGVVVGFAYAGPYRARPAYAHTVECSVYIAPDRRGQGIGRALLVALIARSAAAGKRQMVAVIGDSDNSSSIGLHSALGFRLVGRLESVGFKHGRWLDSVLMQRPLGPSDETLPDLA